MTTSASYKSYTSSFRAPYLPSTSRYVPSSNVRPSGVISTYTTSKPVRTTTFHSPSRSDSVSSRPPLGRPLPNRPSPVSTAQRRRVDLSVDAPGYNAPLRGIRSDGYEKSEKNYSYSSSITASRVASLRANFSSTPETSGSHLVRTGSGLRESRRDTLYKDSSVNDSALSTVDSDGKTVRRRSASVGAATRYIHPDRPLPTGHQSPAKKNDESEKESVSTSEKDEKIPTSKTVPSLSDYDNNNNPSKSDSTRSSGNNGQILGGTAASSSMDDYRHKANGQISSSSKQEKGGKDSSADIMVMGYRSADRGATGLDNLGNTCFMNSILQCLSNTRPLLEFCLDGKYVPDINKKTSQMNGQMIKVYAQLMKSLWGSGKSTSVAPSEFKSQVSRFAKQFVGYSQHDAHEFLIYLLEGLHEEVNRVQEKKKRFIDCSNEVETISAAEKAQMSWEKYMECDNSEIVDIFAGQLKSVLTCKECGYVSNTFDPFFVLSLPIKRKNGLRWSSESTTLADCFDYFTQEETLTEDDRPMCAKCRCRRPCTKRFFIQKFPRILVIHLKRFNQGSSYSKLQTDVVCPVENLDLLKFSASTGQSPVVYNLYAVSNHSGTMYTGHYTAHAKNPYSNQWYYFNDSRVTPVKSPKLSSEAYLLFYELQQD